LAEARALSAVCLTPRSMTTRTNTSLLLRDREHSLLTYSPRQWWRKSHANVACPASTSPKPGEQQPWGSALIRTPVSYRFHPTTFEQVFDAHVSNATRLRLAHRLEGHNGCVNTVHWSDEGDLVITGSDDCTLRIYDATRQYARLGTVETRHSRNIFCARFVPKSAHRQTVSLGADGDVVVTDIEYSNRNNNSSSSSVTTTSSRRIASHYHMLYQFEFLPGSSNVFLSTHEDGSVRLYDTRMPAVTSSTATMMMMGNNHNNDNNNNNSRLLVRLGRGIGATSLKFDPCDNHTFLVASQDPYVRMYDVRVCSQETQRCTQALYYWTARGAEEHSMPRHYSRLSGATGIAFNRLGEVAVNYAGHDVCLFNVRPGLSYARDQLATSQLPVFLSSEVTWQAVRAAEQAYAAAAATPAGLEHHDDDDAAAAARGARHLSPFGTDAAGFKKPEAIEQRTSRVLERSYSGRRNADTFLKEVAFLFGDMYLVTGGDCGHVFVWDKLTGALVQYLRADSCIVNGVAPHPFLPILATCGIDSDAKVWMRSEEVGSVPVESRKCREKLRNEKLAFVQQAVAAAKAAAASASTSTSSSTSPRTSGVDDVAPAPPNPTQESSGNAPATASSDSPDAMQLETTHNHPTAPAPAPVETHHHHHHSHDEDSDDDSGEFGDEDSSSDQDSADDGAHRAAESDNRPYDELRVDLATNDLESAGGGSLSARYSQSLSVVTVAQALERFSEADRQKAEGNTAFNSSNFGRALSHYKDAFSQLHFYSPTVEIESEKNKRLTLVMLNLAACYLKQRSPGQARTLCSTVLHSDPSNTKALYRRAQAAIELKDFDAAQQDLDTALALVPKDAAFLSLMRSLHQKQAAHKEREREIYRSLFSADQ